MRSGGRQQIRAGGDSVDRLGKSDKGGVLRDDGEHLFLGEGGLGCLLKVVELDLRYPDVVRGHLGDLGLDVLAAHFGRIGRTEVPRQHLVDGVLDLLCLLAQLGHGGRSGGERRRQRIQLGARVGLGQDGLLALAERGDLRVDGGEIRLCGRHGFGIHRENRGLNIRLGRLVRAEVTHKDGIHVGEGIPNGIILSKRRQKAHVIDHRRSRVRLSFRMGMIRGRIRSQVRDLLGVGCDRQRA